MNFKPLKERIVLKRDVADEEIGGLYIPEKAREKLNRGTVVQVADDVKDVKIGDRVMFGKHDGVVVDIEGSNYLLLKENQVWCVLSTEN